MRLIDADRLINEFEGCGGNFVYGNDVVSAIISRINIQPTINETDIKAYGNIYELFQPIFDWMSYHYPSNEATFVVTRGGAQMFINHGPQISNQNAWEEAKGNLHNILGDLANRLQNEEAQHAASNEEIERN